MLTYFPWLFEYCLELVEKNNCQMAFLSTCYPTILHNLFYIQLNVLIINIIHTRNVLHTYIEVSLAKLIDRVNIRVS